MFEYFHSKINKTSRKFRTNKEIAVCTGLKITIKIDLQQKGHFKDASKIKWHQKLVTAHITK